MLLNERLGTALPPLPETVSFPLTLGLAFEDLPALAAPGVARNDHRVKILISAEYPYERPRAVWITPIFHPNIMDPADGGFVCVKMLSNWSFSSTLVSFVEGLQHLLRNPNFGSPLGTVSCQAAAAWYREHVTKVSAAVADGAGRCR